MVARATVVKNIDGMSVCPPIKLSKSEGAYIPQSKAIPEPLKNPGCRIYVWKVNGDPG